jgi:glutamate dehydrogenase/leucine dehydrogenase
MTAETGPRSSAPPHSSSNEPLTLPYADELGPEKVLHVRETRTGLRGIVVVDNTAAGPAIGGIRMAVDVTEVECARLARAMTFKNVAAGLAHGGGKAVIAGDPRLPIERKEGLIRAFAHAIAELDDYIPGPDMGTDETCMAWIRDEIGRAVGLPPEIGGIPLDEIGATGMGLAASAAVAKEFCGLELAGARVVIQGYGAVGRHAAHFLRDQGAVVVAVSDSRGAVARREGLDLAELDAIKMRGETVAAARGGTALDRDGVLEVECDIWIPAARPDVLTGETVGRLRTRLVIQGANIPATAEAETWMHEHGILSVPDFVANAGGVICAAVEYHGGSKSQALATIEERISANTREVLARAAREGIEPRAAAVALARERLERAMDLRRRY